jgi:RNA polymerase sigma factor (sigma-70 family)
MIGGIFMLPARTIDVIQAMIPLADDCSDGELLQRYASSRNGAAFAELVRRHGPMVYGTCRRIANNGADADDAFQATFFVLARRACSIRTERIGCWLHGVAVKVARKAQQQASKRRTREMAAAKPEAVYLSMPMADWWAVVDDELKQLPELLRQVILACDIGGKSRSKESRELGWPEGTVAKRLARARQELAARLARRGVTFSVTALSVALATEATAAVPNMLRAETISQAATYAAGPDVSSIAVRTLAEGVLRSMKASVVKMLAITGLTATLLAGAGIMLAGGPTKLPHKEIDRIERAAEPGAKPPEPTPATNLTWRADNPITDPEFDIHSLAISPDGKKFAVDVSNGINTLVFDTLTRTRLFVVSGQGARFIGKDLYTWSGSVKQFDADTGTEKKVSKHFNGMFSSRSQISPDGRMIAGFDCGALRFMDVETGADAVKLTGPGKQIRNNSKPEQEKQARTSSTNQICWSPDGKRVVSLDFDYKVKPIGIRGLTLSDVQAGKQLVSRETTGGSRNICFGFSPDGKTLGAGGLTGDKRGASSLAILNAATLETIRSIPIDSRDGGADVTAVAFSPDGSTVAAGVNLHSGKAPLVRVLLWDSATGEIIHLLPDHDTPLIAALSFTPDGKTLVAATGSVLEEPRSKETLHRILIWRGEPKKK